MYQVLAPVALLVVGVGCFFVRRQFYGRSIRWLVGAIVIGLIWISDELYFCVSASCRLEFLQAIKFEDLSFSVCAFYVHVVFALVEGYFFWRYGRGQA